MNLTHIRNVKCKLGRVAVNTWNSLIMDACVLTRIYMYVQQLLGIRLFVRGSDAWTYMYIAGDIFIIYMYNCIVYIQCVSFQIWLRHWYMTAYSSLSFSNDFISLSQNHQYTVYIFVSFSNFRCNTLLLCLLSLKYINVHWEGKVTSRGMNNYIND